MAEAVVPCPCGCGGYSAPSAEGAEPAAKAVSVDPAAAEQDQAGTDASPQGASPPEVLDDAALRSIQVYEENLRRACFT